MAFNVLPIELNQAIAKYLESDKDVCAFSTVCHSTHNAVEGDRGSFWRTRFRERFAYDQKKTNMVLKKQYQDRRKQLKAGLALEFLHGIKQPEKDVMRVLRDLILESFHGAGAHNFDSYPICPNLRALKNFVRDSKHFLGVKRLPPNSISQRISSELAAIQLMCGHFLFEPEMSAWELFSFEVSQKAVYESPKTCPIFRGVKNLEVDMEWALHCLNFFRYHMMSEDAHTLHETIDAMDVLQKPSAWNYKLQNHRYHHLSRHWKGTYAYLDRGEIVSIRRSPPGQNIYIDKNVELGKLQTLELRFPKTSTWPSIFEHHLDSLRGAPIPNPKTRAQHRSSEAGKPTAIHFTGEGEDEEHFYASGWLNPLPDQPNGFEIPGWQRVTFMKHFIDDNAQLDQDNLWAYEGVVLPGGQIMLGRWWYADEIPNHRTYSGPFIFWAVEGGSESVDFGDSDV
ncbi:hypothetical protein GQ43DRAFT_377200 [Delitschia confertaspora ATCC 74209]|uniref:F-box domain-containing protein n=1 Tax=Delitschia confertaspora ATCC 74209 TaxID=1513339 RepID=A0A9P4JGJ8_9PLEO|nr:hypothetical protein GQ43DRAFT_377200 [Delitschia confertaspora ATCC 74209]